MSQHCTLKTRQWGVVVSCIVSVICAIAGTAHSETTPRRVALVNVAVEQGAGARAIAQLREELRRDALLVPIPTGDISRALEAPLAVAKDKRVAALDKARSALAQAQEDMAQFAYSDALTSLERGAAVLRSVVPSAPVLALYAQLAFERGRIHARDGDREQAITAFTLAQRLAPGQSVDPKVYLPEIVALYQAAASARTTRVTLSVSSLYDGVTIYVDGKHVGTTPVVVDVEAGVHLVTGTYAGGQVRGETVAVGPKNPATVKLDLGSVARDDALRHWRQGMIAGPPLLADAGGGRRADVAAKVAQLVDVDAVILVASNAAGECQAAIYNIRTGNAHPWQALSDVAFARDLRALLMPVAIPPPGLPPMRFGPGWPRGDPGPPIGPRDTPPRAGAEWPKWVVIGVGSALVVAGSAVWSLTREASVICCVVGGGAVPTPTWFRFP